MSKTKTRPVSRFYKGYEIFFLMSGVYSVRIGETVYRHSILGKLKKLIDDVINIKNNEAKQLFIQ